MKSLLVLTVYISLFVQIVTALLDVVALQFKVLPRAIILRQALILELIVQIVEGLFYVWLVFAIHSAHINITPKRYYDWFLTTPTMLFTLMVYLEFLKRNEKEKREMRMKTFVEEYGGVIGRVVVLNALMLIFGYLGERGVLRKKTSVAIGFIPFIVYYVLIYQTFVVDNPEGKMIYWYFVLVWTIYGLAALLPYHPKNMFFNILDLFAKNFFGLYLSYLLFVNRQT